MTLKVNKDLDIRYKVAALGTLPFFLFRLVLATDWIIQPNNVDTSAHRQRAGKKRKAKEKIKRWANDVWACALSLESKPVETFFK